MCFNFTCTPTKQKKTLDYILDWIKLNGPILQKDTEDIAVLKAWKEEVSDDYIQAQIDAAIQAYDWSQVPEFDEKADKVENAVLGHLASLDANGNLVDSGSGIDEAIEQGNMDLATCNAVYTALQGFAPSIHYHSEIKAPGAFANYAYAKIQLGVSSSPVFQLKVGGVNDTAAQVEVNVDNVENLKIALKNPSTTPEDDATKLITSKAVYDALLGKMGTLKEIFIECDDSDTWEVKPDAAGEAAFENALVWNNTAPRLVLITISKVVGGAAKKYRTIGSIHATSVEVFTEEYDLTAEIYVDGHVFTRTGREIQQEDIWNQGLTLASDDIFTAASDNL